MGFGSKMRPNVLLICIEYHFMCIMECIVLLQMNGYGALHVSTSSFCRPKCVMALTWENINLSTAPCVFFYYSFGRPYISKTVLSTDSLIIWTKPSE